MNPETYQQINETCRQKLVFNLDSRAGFFSEYNMMILCMIYCLRNQIQFQLYSGDSLFRIRNGWTDFFQPFCPEQTSLLHQVFNYRFPRADLKFKLRKYIGGPLVRTLCQCNFLTYDLWNGLRSQSPDIPVIIPGRKQPVEFRMLCRELVQMTWRFQPDIEQEINQSSRRVGLPRRYLGVHIRCGDKIKEFEGCSPDAYMARLERFSDLRDVLVMTDDYRIFEQLTADYPQWRFHTLETPEHRGYWHRTNRRKPVQTKRSDYIRFFAGINLIMNSEQFVGTYSSNIGGFLGMCMDPDRCHAVDSDHWRLC